MVFRNKKNLSVLVLDYKCCLIGRRGCHAVCAPLRVTDWPGESSSYISRSLIGQVILHPIYQGHWLARWAFSLYIRYWRRMIGSKFFSVWNSMKHKHIKKFQILAKNILCQQFHNFSKEIIWNKYQVSHARCKHIVYKSSC